MTNGENLREHLGRVRVVPLIQADKAETALATVEALMAGGLDVIEVVLRTDTALTCLREVARSFPAAVVGAGTVLRPVQAEQAIGAGAAFIVSPGLHEGVVRVAQDAGLPVYPGVVTATELQMAWNLGLDTVKFFPASLAGGPAMLKALAAAFRGVQFIPTGGVSADNLAQFLAVPPVLACGGSWLTPAEAIAAGEFDIVRQLAEQARSIASSARE